MLLVLHRADSHVEILYVVLGVCQEPLEEHVHIFSLPIMILGDRFLAKARICMSSTGSPAVVIISERDKSTPAHPIKRSTRFARPTIAGENGTYIMGIILCGLWEYMDPRFSNSSKIPSYEDTMIMLFA